MCRPGNGMERNFRRNDRKTFAGYVRHSHAPWHEEDPKEDPWANLAWAIVISGFIDYLEEYEHKIKLNPSTDKMFLVHESRCIDLENWYFRGNPTLEKIFEKMLINVCWKGVGEIERCRKRLMAAIGWLKKPDTIKKTREERAAEKQAAAEERFRKLFAELEEDFPEDDFGPGDARGGYRYQPYDRDTWD